MKTVERSVPRSAFERFDEIINRQILAALDSDDTGETARLWGLKVDAKQVLQPVADANIERAAERLLRELVRSEGEIGRASCRERV